MIKNLAKKKPILKDEFLEIVNSSVSMFPLNLQLTPTHLLNIASIIEGCLKSGYLIELSHVTIGNEYLKFINVNND